jgi:N-acetylmuramic acid 6-phosphate etherase
MIPTEQVNPRTVDIDLLSTEQVLRKINAEDQLVALAVEKAIPQITVVVDAIRQAFENGGRLFYFGAGTSGRLGVLDASECPPTYGASPELVQGIIAGGDMALRNAVEGAEDSLEQGEADVQKAGLKTGDVAVGISASGQAPYVVAAMRAAKALGCFTAGLTCDPSAQLAQAVHQPIVVEVGPEAVAGSTRMKAGTAQKLVLNMLTTGAMIQSGKTFQNLMVDVQPTNLKLKARAKRIVAALGQVSTDEAGLLLEQSAYQVKPAVLMARDKIGLAEALTRLQAASGKLRLAFHHSG